MSKKRSISVSLDGIIIESLDKLKRDGKIESRSKMVRDAINKELRKYQLDIIGNGQQQVLKWLNITSSKGKNKTPKKKGI